MRGLGIYFPSNVSFVGVDYGWAGESKVLLICLVSKSDKPSIQYKSIMDPCWSFPGSNAHVKSKPCIDGEGHDNREFKFDLETRVRESV